MKQADIPATLNYSHVSLLPSEQIGLHSQPTWELSYIVHGVGLRQLGCSVEHFAEGDAVLVPPGMCHQWMFGTSRTTSGGCIENVTVAFAPEWLQRLGHMMPEYEPMAAWYGSLRSALVFEPSDASRVGALLQQMDCAQPHERVTQLLSLLGYVYAYCREAPSVQPQPADVDAARIKQIDIYLDCNFQRHVCLADLAIHVGMTRSGLCAFYKRHTGTTIFSTLVSRRLSAARHLLATSQLSVSQCCYQSGFNDMPHFCRTFKRIVGLSPNGYRAKYYHTNNPSGGGAKP